MKHWHTKKTCSLLFLGILAALLAACSPGESSEAEKCAKAFASSYFNLRFEQAAKLCTQNSEKWIRMQASNIQQQDIDVLNMQKDTAECEVESIETNADTATAVLKIQNFLSCDSVGKPGYICKQAVFTVTLTKTNDVWQVDLTKPLEKERTEE